MPLKSGPNGTMRYYSSSNGRYAVMSKEEFLAYNGIKISKKEERREKRSKYLHEIALRSKDPLLLEVFDFLEQMMPHYVQFVNQNVYIKSEKHVRETDIIGKNAIIEIKSGKKCKWLKQLLRQKEVANERKLKMVLFAPNVSYNAKSIFENNGIIVVKNKNELYKELKK